MQVKLTKKAADTLPPTHKSYDVFDIQIKGFLLRVHPSGKKVFYYSYRNSARKRNRIMIGVFGSSTTVEQARDKAKDYASQVSKGIDVQAEKANARHKAVEQQSNTLQAFLDEHYEPWQMANFKDAKRTISRIRKGFKKLLALPLHDITHSIIDKARTEKKRTGLSPNTINRHVNILRGALSRAVEWGVIQEHPFKKIKNLKIDKSPKVRYLTDDESKRLWAALAERDEDIKQARERGNIHRQERGYDLMPSLLDQAYADRLTPMVILALKTGVRQGELFDLRWQDVNIDAQQLTIPGDNTKSSHTRHIPLSPMALEALKKWRQQAPLSKADSRVFPANEQGERLNNIRKSWVSLLQHAGITNFRWHDLRHDFASQLVMNGIPLNTVRELCGHASMDTTLRYAHLAPDHKMDAVASLG